MVLRFAQQGFATAARLANILPCPTAWLRPGFEAALGWIALPFVQRFSGIGPDTAATVDRLGAQLHDLERTLGRLAAEADAIRSARRRRARARLHASETQAAHDRAQTAAAEQRLAAATHIWDAERERLAGLGRQLEAQLQSIVVTDAARTHAATGLAHELAAAQERTASERARRAQDANAHVAALDAGWRQRCRDLADALSEHAHAADETLAAATRAWEADRSTLVAQATQLDDRLRATLDAQRAQADVATLHTAELQGRHATLVAASEDHLTTITRAWDQERTQLVDRVARLDEQLRTTATVNQTHSDAVAALTTQLAQAQRHTMIERDRREHDAAAQLAAIEAGWRQRGADIESAAREQLAETSAALTTDWRQRTQEMEQTWTDRLAAAANTIAALQAACAQGVTERDQLTASVTDHRTRLEALTRATDTFRQEHHDVVAAHIRATTAAEHEHERLRADVRRLELHLANGAATGDDARHAHESALADAYQTLSERDQDLEQMRQRAQRLEVARAAAVEEARRLRESLSRPATPTTAAPSAAPPVGDGAGTVAGAIARLLKSGANRPSSDDGES